MIHVTLADVVSTSEAVRGVSGRLDKRRLLVQLFSRLAPPDLKLAACFLAGEVPHGKLRVGWKGLMRARGKEHGPPQPSLFGRHTGRMQAPPQAGTDTEPAWPPPPETRAAPRATSPTLEELDTALASIKQVTGAGSTHERQQRLRNLLFPLATAEREFISALLLGELRHGALRAAVVEAVAETCGVDTEALRRAIMFSGSFAEVVDQLARDGGAALDRFGPRPLVPIEPMLAAQAESLEDLRLDGELAVEWKLDGVRLQAHRLASEVRLFTRQGRDVTLLVPSVVELVGALAVESVILDGEVVGQDTTGRPLPFQDLMSRFATQQPEAPATGLFGLDAVSQPESAGQVHVVFFDILALDGVALVDRPYRERMQVLDRVVPPSHRMTRRMIATHGELRAFCDEALAAGHEGIMVKFPEAPYTAGRRGAAWRKFKPAVTLDLVILAAEWGHGRRGGWLSNLHLGAPDGTRFAMLGKTFKGLTDEMLRQMTADLLRLQTSAEGGVVHVRPERVVEVAFDSIQRSRRYDSGLALRFARVKRFRPDKNAGEANTLDDVRRLAAAQNL